MQTRDGLPQRTILIVDDEAAIAGMLADYFTMEGYRALTASNGAEALRRASEPVDVVLLDVNMPGMDGFEVCRRLREHLACPIIFLTARIEDVDQIDGFAAGADDYVLKPFSLEVLGRRVAAHIAREGRHREREQSVRFFQGITVDYGERQVTVDVGPGEVARAGKGAGADVEAAAAAGAAGKGAGTGARTDAEGAAAAGAGTTADADTGAGAAAEAAAAAGAGASEGTGAGAGAVAEAAAATGAAPATAPAPAPSPARERRVDLTRTEFDIVALLSKSPGRVFDRDLIYERVWGWDAAGDPSIVREHVRRVRKKLAAAGAPEDCIETVWGVGYRWSAR